jgi:CRP-like cAMP-binding protein
VSRLGSGDVFGEMQLLTGKTRRFGVISLTDTTVYQIMKEDIALFIQKNPELAERFSKKLSERQMVINAQMEIHEAQKLDKEALSSQILDRIQQYFGVKEKPGETAPPSQDTLKKKDS